MKIIRSLFCENVVNDSETKNVIIYNLFEEVSSPGFPILLQKLALYIFCENEAPSILMHDLDIKLFINEQPLFSGKLRIIFQNNLTKTRAVAKFNGIVFPIPGFFYAKLYYQGEQQPFHEVGFNISLTPQMTATNENKSEEKTA
jgi:hypothetical protein